MSLNPGLGFNRIPRFPLLGAVLQFRKVGIRGLLPGTIWTQLQQAAIPLFLLGHRSLSFGKKVADVQGAPIRGLTPALVI